MNYFNHEIEYLPTCKHFGGIPQHCGIKIRCAVIHYDNSLGVRCQYRFAAPADLWTHIIVGGTKSNGGTFSVGILATLSPPRYGVLIDTLEEVYCHALCNKADLHVGQNVIVFDHMGHDAPGGYGEFRKAFVVDDSIADKLDLHSINVIIFKDTDPIGTIHIDPLINTANYDDCKIKLANGQLWCFEEFLVL